MRIEYYGANRYRFAGDTSQKSNASFIANNLLAGRGIKMNSTNTNVGGWDGCAGRTFCNTRLYDALPVAWQSMLKQVKINASAGNKSTEILISEDYVYLASYTELSNNQSEPYVSEGEYITWFTSDVLRAKFRGLIIPDDASYYTEGSDPSTVSSNTVKFGDVWKINGNGVCYIYVDQETADGYNLSLAYTASIGGGWVSASGWWERSPYAANTTNFCNVHTDGNAGTNYAYYVYGVCPCFSI